MENASTGNGTENPEVKDAPENTRDREEDLLAALHKELAGRVASLQIVTPERGPLYLRVTARSGRTEDVRAAAAEGCWWFVGPSAEPIGPGDDVISSAVRLLDAFTRADLRVVAGHLPSSVRWWLVRTPDGAGLRVDAGGRSGRMWTVVTVARDWFCALVETGTPVEAVGPVTDPAEAARRVARMLGAA